MSLVGLVNLAERLLNQGSTQGQDPQTAQKAASTPPTRGAQGTAEDLFTPSAQNALAQDAGLFSVAQLSFFSAAADFLLGQATPQQPAAAPAVNTPANATQAAAQAAVPGAANTPRTQKITWLLGGSRKVGARRLRPIGNRAGLRNRDRVTDG